MATTTNYGWTTPEDTALVKDGASAIRTLGSSVDTTTKNLNPETTLGDLSFRSSTSNVNTRIPIGSSGQHLTVVAGVPAWATASDQTPLTTKGDLFTFSTVDARLGVGANGTTLVADSAEATGLKWAAASAGAITKIASNTFSSQASVDVDNCFTSTYKMYMVVLGVFGSVSQEDLLMQYRYAGPSTQTTDYYGSYLWYGRGVGLVDYSFTATSGNVIDPRQDITTEAPCTIYINRVGNASEKPFSYATGFSAGGAQAWTGFSGYVDTARTYTGFRLISTSGNISGRYAVYGLEN